MRKIPELLAPVGGMLQLKAAVENGADAVYLGGKHFNARMNAGNFSEEELREAISYAHLRGVRVHLTMNTLLSDEELPDALEAAFFVYEAGIDALIVQDLGLAEFIHRAIPEVALHLSTQGTVYNVQGVRQAANLGFSRVVLAREVTLDEIKNMTSQTDTELEVFVHGALCMCYSGQCHMSREIGGRSGNRGECAQPCRLPYELFSQSGTSEPKQENKGALLSPKDLCLLDYLPQLAEAGVASLKIEGRMKSPEYVGLVTAIYRKYLDLYSENGIYVVEEEDRVKLKQVFSRGGFSTGYLLGNPRKGLMTGDMAKHQGTFLGVVVGNEPRRKQVQILLENKLSMGDGIEIRSCHPANKSLPGNVVTYLRKQGSTQNSSGESGDCVTVGDISGICSPGDSVYKITDRQLMEAVRSTYEKNSGEAKKQLKKRAVGVSFSAELSQPAALTLWDLTSDLCVSLQSEKCCEEARTKPLTKELVQAQMGKTGETPFRICHWDIKLQDGLSLPVSALNELRRVGLCKLEERLLSVQCSTLSAEEKQSRRERTLGTEPSVCDEKTPQDQGDANRAERGAALRLSVYLHRADLEALTLASGASFSMPDGIEKRVSRLYVPYSLFLKETDEAIAQAAGELEIIPYLPTITKGSYDDHIQKHWQRLLPVAKQRGIAIGNQGWISAFVKEGAVVYGDYGLNVCNSMDIQLALQAGMRHTVLSHEFDGNDRIFHKGSMECETAVGGAFPLMISAHCPIGDLRENGANTVENCSLCGKKHYFIKDRKNENYAILSDKKDCSCMVLSEKMEIDRKKYGWCLDNNMDCIRIYGIDKTIFLERT